MAVPFAPCLNKKFKHCRGCSGRKENNEDSSRLAERFIFYPRSFLKKVCERTGKIGSFIALPK